MEDRHSLLQRIISLVQILLSLNSAIYTTCLMYGTTYASIYYFNANYFCRVIAYFCSLRLSTRVILRQPYMYISVVGFFAYSIANLFYLGCYLEVDFEPYNSFLPPKYTYISEVFRQIVCHLLFPLVACEYFAEQRCLLALIRRDNAHPSTNFRLGYSRTHECFKKVNERWSTSAAIWIVSISAGACLELGTFITWLSMEDVSRIELITMILSLSSTLYFVMSITWCGDLVYNTMRNMRRRLMADNIAHMSKQSKSSYFWYSRELFCVQTRGVRLTDRAPLTTVASYLQLSTDLSLQPVEFTFYSAMNFRRSLVYSILMILITYMLVIFQMPTIVSERQIQNPHNLNETIRHSRICLIAAQWLT